MTTEEKILAYLKADAKKRGMPNKIFQVVWERQARELATLLDNGMV
jgi:hypothetical protein